MYCGGLKKKCFIQRFDNCRDYAAVQMDPALITFIQNNYSQITTAKLKPLAYKITNNLRDSIQEIPSVDHSCHQMFEVHWGRQRDTIDIDDFLLAASYNSEHPNLNFSANQKNILNELRSLALKDIQYYFKSH